MLWVWGDSLASRMSPVAISLSPMASCGWMNSAEYSAWCASSDLIASAIGLGTSCTADGVSVASTPGPARTSPASFRLRALSSARPCRCWASERSFVSSMEGPPALRRAPALVAAGLPDMASSSASMRSIFSTQASSTATLSLRAVFMQPLVPLRRLERASALSADVSSSRRRTAAASFCRRSASISRWLRFTRSATTTEDGLGTWGTGRGGDGEEAEELKAEVEVELAGEEGAGGESSVEDDDDIRGTSKEEEEEDSHDS